MLYWSQIPLVRAVLPFALGIVLSLQLGRFLSPMFLICGIGLVLATSVFTYFRIESYQSRWLWGFQINLVLLLLGLLFAVVEFNQWEKDPLPSNKKALWIGTVEDINSQTDSSAKAIVKLSAYKIDTTFQKTEKKLLLYLRTEKQIFVGDEISAVSYFNLIPSAKNPAAFDYAEFMKKRRIFHQSFATDFNKVNEKWSLGKVAADIREKLIKNYKEMGITGNNLAVLIAISLGDKNYLEQSLKEKYAGAGAMHILAVSGLHVGIVYLLFSFLLLPFEKLRYGKYAKGIILLFVIWFFALLTGFSPSVQRAALMFSFIAIAKMMHYRTNVLNSIAASAFLILLFKPMLIFEVGFQLSYAAVVGIVWMHPIVYGFWVAPNILLDKLWSLIVVSIAAQLATLPFVLYYFHQFPNWFLLTNLFIIPLAFLIVASAVVVAIFYFVFSTAFAINYLLLASLYLMNAGIDLLSKLPFFVSDGIWISLFSAILLALSIASIMAYLDKLKFGYLRVAMALILLLMVVEFSLNLIQSQKRSFGIYATNGESVYVFINGLEATVFVEDTLGVYSKSIVNNHLKSIGVRKYKVEDLSTDQFGNGYKYINSTNHAVFSFDDCLILFTKLSDPTFIESMCVADYLILKKENRWNDEKQKNCSLKTLIDGSVPSWDYSIRNLSNKQDVRIINTDGYYSIY